MTCSACSAHVEKAVRQVEGVDSVSVNLLGNSMLVEYGGKTGPEQIIQAVTDAGLRLLPGPPKAAPAAWPMAGGGTGGDEAPLPHVLSVSGACSTSPWGT